MWSYGSMLKIRWVDWIKNENALNHVVQETFSDINESHCLCCGITSFYNFFIIILYLPLIVWVICVDILKVVPKQKVFHSNRVNINVNWIIIIQSFDYSNKYPGCVESCGVSRGILFLDISLNPRCYTWASHTGTLNMAWPKPLLFVSRTLPQKVTVSPNDRKYRLWNRHYITI